MAIVTTFATVAFKNKTIDWLTAPQRQQRPHRPDHSVLSG